MLLLRHGELRGDLEDPGQPEGDLGDFIDGDFSPTGTVGEWMGDD